MGERTYIMKRPQILLTQKPKSGPADQPNIQEDLSPRVLDVDEVEDVWVRNNGHNDGDLKLDVDLDLEEELIDRLLKLYM